MEEPGQLPAQPHLGIPSASPGDPHRAPVTTPIRHAHEPGGKV
ncbi:hypothetical protein [Streptomyces violascens]